MTNERDIAAAEAVRTQDLSGNAGTGHIGAGAQTSSSGTSLPATPITLTFDGSLNQFTVSTGGTLAYDPASDTGSTLTVNIAGLGDFSFTMTGTRPTATSSSCRAMRAVSVTIATRGDWRSAVGQDDDRRYRDFRQHLWRIDCGCGHQDQPGSRQCEVQSHLLSQAEAAKSEVSGVNLDEEAADLVRFQQAYQAAQVISVANTLFDSLLSAVRR